MLFPTEHGQWPQPRAAVVIPNQYALSATDERPSRRTGDFMQERDLRAFVAIVEAGRMDHAASLLGYSQPAVSYQIKCLEQELGARLFLRHPGGTELTREGTMMLPATRAALSLMDGIREITAQQSRTPAGRLRAGRCPTCQQPSTTECFRHGQRTVHDDPALQVITAAEVTWPPPARP
jgi:hypothetical protein